MRPELCARLHPRLIHVGLLATSELSGAKADHGASVFGRPLKMLDAGAAARKIPAYNVMYAHTRPRKNNEQHSVRLACRIKTSVVSCGR